MRFFTTEQLSENRERLPSGFLLLHNVPIGRTGMQIYGPGETPIESRDNVKVYRRPEDVFRTKTLQSFHGVPLTIDHPDQDVNSENWGELSKGIVLNPHRGVGIEDDLMLADVLVCDAETIKKIEEGDLKEVSSGYDASYVEDSEQYATGYQTEIMGNHVALVEQGRCGPRCSIRDQEGGIMSKLAAMKDKIWKAFQNKDGSALADVLSSLGGDTEDQGVAGEEAGRSPEETHIHIHQEFEDPGIPASIQSNEPLPPKDDVGDDEEEEGGEPSRLEALERELKNIGDRLDALEGGTGDDEDEVADEEDVEDEDTADEDTGDEEDEEDDVPERIESNQPEPGTGDRRGRDKRSKDRRQPVVRRSVVAAKGKDSSFRDSRYMEHSIQQTLAAAEVLVPGISFPTFDRVAAARKTADRLDALRKKALGIVGSTMDGATMLAELRGGRPLTTAALKKMSAKDTKALFYAAAAASKQRNRDRQGKFEIRDHMSSPAQNIAEMNRVNKEFWSKRVN